MGYKVQIRTNPKRPPESSSGLRVTILGAGLAGCATAISLRHRRPDVEVEVLDRAEESSVHDKRLGAPVLAKAAVPSLLELGIAEQPGASEILAGGGPQTPLHAVWSERELEGDQLPFASWGGSLEVTPARLLGWLRTAAREAGARFSFSLPAGECRARLRTADWSVDASGRGASLARTEGGSFVRKDRLVALGLSGGVIPSAIPGPIVEATDVGWWYASGGGEPLDADQQITSSQPVVVLFTDLDLLVEHGLTDPAHWRLKLAATKHLAELAEGLELPEQLTRLAADTRWLKRVSGNGWMAVGDAALSFDPCVSSAAQRALASGSLAGFALDDLLRARQTGDQVAERRAHRKLASLHTKQIAGLLSLRRTIYSGAERHQECEFWHRRALHTSAESGYRQRIG